MGQSNSLVPTEKDHIQKKRISGEIFKELLESWGSWKRTAHTPLGAR